MERHPINSLIHHSNFPVFQFRSVRAVTFDVGGTLIKPCPSVGHVYAAVAARHGLFDLSTEVLDRQFAAAWKNLSAFNYTRAEWFDLVNQSFAGLAKTPISEALFNNVYSHFGRAEAWRIFDDVLPTLDSLRSRDLRLGIISNWDERLRPLLHELKLDHYFHTLVISCEVGAGKPSPAIFQRAAHSLACPPASILHIGDSPAFDLGGATSSGFQALLLARGPTAISGQLASLNLLPSVLFPM